MSIHFHFKVIQQIASKKSMQKVGELNCGLSLILIYLSFFPTGSKDNSSQTYCAQRRSQLLTLPVALWERSLFHCSHRRVHLNLPRSARQFPKHTLVQNDPKQQHNSGDSEVSFRFSIITQILASFFHFQSPSSAVKMTWNKSPRPTPGVKWNDLWRASTVEFLCTLLMLLFPVRKNMNV